MRTIPNWRTPYRIGMLQEFTNSTKHFYSSRDTDGTYYVWSYSTLIAEYRDDVWYLNDTSYSFNTSRHQGLVRQALSMRTLNDMSIHFYHVRMNTTRLTSLVYPNTVMMQRIKRIQANSWR